MKGSYLKPIKEGSRMVVLAHAVGQGDGRRGRVTGETRPILWKARY